MNEALFYLTLINIFVLSLLTVEAYLALRTQSILMHIPETLELDPPTVSVIIPARNEERTVEKGLASVLKQDYPNLEILVINDRSRDRTGKILERLAVGQDRLRILHLSTLPVGWIGKNYALFVGSKQARGDLLLFSDADIIMNPTTVSRAVTYLQSRKLDHLTMAPEILASGVCLKTAITVFCIFFALYMRPWKARNPKSKAHIGIGAFNLLKKSVYEAIGTHRAISMRPDDDVKLGKLVKKNEFSQDFLPGQGLLKVEWYPSLHAFNQGLMKNSFALMDYSVFRVVAVSLTQLLFSVWPFVAIFLTSGTTQVLNLLVVVFFLISYYGHGRYYNLMLPSFLGFPFAALLLIFILWKSMIQTLLRGGIQWRGTFYRLQDLRANRI